MRYLGIEQGAQKILRLTERMMTAAQGGEWDEMTRIETERQQSLHSLFLHPNINTALPIIAAVLQQVIDIDKNSIALGERARHSLSALLDISSQSESAIRAYLSPP